MDNVVAGKKKCRGCGQFKLSVDFSTYKDHYGVMHTYYQCKTCKGRERKTRRNYYTHDECVEARALLRLFCEALECHDSKRLRKHYDSAMEYLKPRKVDGTDMVDCDSLPHRSDSKSKVI